MIDMDEIKKAVNEFKKKNGNDKYQLEDLVIYAINRIDNLPCESHTKVISGNETRSKMTVWALGIEIAVIALIFSVML